MEVLANSTVIMVLQYINVSNQHTVHVQLMQCYISIISQLKKSPEKYVPIYV